MTLDEFEARLDADIDMFLANGVSRRRLISILEMQVSLMEDEDD